MVRTRIYIYINAYYLAYMHIYLYMSMCMCTCTCTCTCMYKHVYCNMRDVYDMPYSNPDFQKKWTPDKPDTDNYKI